MKVTTLTACTVLALSAWSPQALAQQKTVKACKAEWAAHRAEIAASGKTQRIFVAECRGVSVAAVAKGRELLKGQYASEADAKASCASETVVWVNFSSGVYHSTGSRSYGVTRSGAYMCEKDSVAAGFRAPKSAALKPSTT